MGKIPFIDSQPDREPLGYRLIDGAWHAYYERLESELAFYERMGPPVRVAHRRPPSKG